VLEEEEALQEVLAEQYPALRTALDRVRDVEAQLHTLSAPRRELHQAFEMEKREHQRTTEKLLILLRKRSGQNSIEDAQAAAAAPEAATPEAGSTAEAAAPEAGSTAEAVAPEAGSTAEAVAPEARAPIAAAPEAAAPDVVPTGMTDTELKEVRDSLIMLDLQGRQATAMQTMLREIAPDGFDGEVAETLGKLHEDLAKSEATRALISEQLTQIVMSEQIATDDLAKLRDLMVTMQDEQKQAKVRSAQLTWLQAESKRVRLLRLHDAKARLEALQQEARKKSEPSLECAYPPVAVAEDESSISIDWLAPMSKEVGAYHLQWREIGESEWTDSEASLSIKVPMCTKGNLRGGTHYEFRVRACSTSGMWGGFSDPSEPATPSPNLEMAPSRPLVRPAGKGRIAVRWTDQDNKAAERYELQWRKVDAGGWKQCDRVMITSDMHLTPALHLGSAYIFRVRASSPTYIGSQWTNFSQPSAPIRPLARDPTVVAGNDSHARNLTSARRAMQQAGVPFLADEDSVVHWPGSSDLAESGIPSMPRRRSGEGSVVGSTWGTETEIVAELRATAAGFEPGTEAQAQAQAEIQAIDAMRQQKQQLRAMNERQMELTDSDHEQQLQGLQKIESQLLTDKERLDRSRMAPKDPRIKPATSKAPSDVSVPNVRVIRSVDYAQTLD